MKKLFLLIIVFTGAFGCMQAQDSETRDMSDIIDSRVEDLTERLTLTEVQVTKVRAIYEKTLGVDFVSETPGVSSSEQRHNEIMELLDTDQKIIYQEYLDGRGSRFNRSGVRLERA